MIDLAAIRPDEWGLPLFLHVLGAFTMVGALVMAASYLFAARRDAGRACVLDAARPPEALFEQAREVVAARLAHWVRQPANV